MRAQEFPDLPERAGFASRKELKRGKVSDTVLQRWADAGRRPLRAVYARDSRDLSEREPADRLLAGSLWAGAGAVLTSTWALRLYGVSVRREPDLTRFLVPMSRRARTSARGFATHRVRSMPTAVVRSGVRVASVERALADAARFGDVLAWELRGITLSILCSAGCRRPTASAPSSSGTASTGRRPSATGSPRSARARGRTPRQS